MKEVQNALAYTGIPVFALAWRSTAEYPTAPDRYIVYTTMTTEDHHMDDALQEYRIYVYLNLWCRNDPTDDTLTVREAMRAAGFELVEENDSYETETDTFCVSSTWLLRKEASDGAEHQG